MWAERTPKSSSDSSSPPDRPPLSAPKMVVGLCVLTHGQFEVVIEIPAVTDKVDRSDD